MTTPLSDVERVFREHHGRAIAVLVRAFGDIQLAEESVSDAFTIAAERWPSEGTPPSPAGWIITTARHRAIDRLRREAERDNRQREAVMLQTKDEPPEESTFSDDQLRLIFTCCHPSLATSTQVALTLRLVQGLTMPEIAPAFLVPEATMSQRLTRAKAKIREAKIPYRVPDAEDLPARLKAVLGVVYLVFNEGYAASRGERLIRADLCAEAIRLGRLLALLMPDEPEVWGLLALMLFLESRRAARTTEEGKLVPLAAQDRASWDHSLIEEARSILQDCLRKERPGPYQIQAAINAVHCDAPAMSATDWKQILTLYDQLLAMAPSPVTALNRAVALAEVRGPEMALSEIEKLGLDEYYLFHAIRADLLQRVRRNDDAKVAYQRAILLTENEAERAFMRSKLALVGTAS